MLTVGSLFSGAGLCDLGLTWAGFKHQWFCEIDPFCQAVLARHWPETAIYNDVSGLNGMELPPVDVLCGGFPCQDVSSAGARAGIKQGTRSGLWYEYARLIGEIRPRYVIIENVRGLLSCGIEVVLQDLANIGYDAEWEVPRTIGSGCSLLPTLTVAALTEGLGCCIRSRETWETTTNLGSYLLGWVCGLTGCARRPPWRPITAPSFAEWMMGVPRGWTQPHGPSLASLTK